jgi:hypothetical protein
MRIAYYAAQHTPLCKRLRILVASTCRSEGVTEPFMLCGKLATIHVGGFTRGGRDRGYMTSGKIDVLGIAFHVRFM